MPSEGEPGLALVGRRVPRTDVGPPFKRWSANTHLHTSTLRLVGTALGLMMREQER